MSELVVSADEIDLNLERAFEAARKLYQARGFGADFGFGKRAAVITIDLANAWTQPNSPFTCDQDRMNNQIIPGVQRLQDAARRNGHAVVHVTTAYQNNDKNDPNSDLGIWPLKVPVECLHQVEDNDLWKIDSRIAPLPGERVIIKKSASGFPGTDLHNYLTSIGVDTVIVTGVTASCCVRATIYDALAHGFRPIAVSDCIGDRIPAAVHYNLFDIGAKLGDVKTSVECVEYLESKKLNA